jgi:hypothetical protein
VRKLLLYFLAAVLLMGCAPRRAQAQFIGFTSPQTVSQTVASNIACNPTISVVVPNLGQSQHTLTFTQNTGTESVFASLLGSNDGVTFFQISDTAVRGAFGAISASGYFPVVKAQLSCSNAATRVTATYAGTSVTPGATFADIDNSYYTKVVTPGGIASAGSGFTSPTFTTPYGSLSGYLLFNYSGGAGPSGSTIQVNCGTPTAAGFPVFGIPLTTTAVQVFALPNVPCETMSILYTSGGANANTIAVNYHFLKPGSQFPSTSGNVLGSASNLGGVVVEKGSRWSVLSTPAAGSQATTSKAASALGFRHVADCVSYSAGAIAAPVATALQINLRDGASGAGTIIWSKTVTIPATAAPHYDFSVCGLNLIGTANTAMTLEFSALLASESQSVTLTGYDVQ